MKAKGTTAPRALPARLEDLPNVGPAVAADFRRLGIGTPDEIRGRDPYMLYHDLCRATHSLHDPCLLDTFIAVVRYVEGGMKPFDAAIKGDEVNGPAKTRILRAVNTLLKTKKVAEVTLKELF